MRLTLAALLIAATALPAQQTGGTAILMPLREKKVTRDDYKLTDALRGVRFDLDGDGTEEQTAWTHGSSGLGFLALDRNGNGKIDNGRELFGSATHPDKKNGFSALLKDAGPYGCCGDIGLGHGLFEKLLLWEDANHNGLSDPGELEKFSDHYVAISLGYGDDAWTDDAGNVFRYQGNAVIRTGESKKCRRRRRCATRGRSERCGIASSIAPTSCRGLSISTTCASCNGRWTAAAQE